MIRLSIWYNAKPCISGFLNFLFCICLQQSAAKGAEEFYQVTNNAARSEGLELARELDTKAAQVGPLLLCGDDLFHLH